MLHTYRNLTDQHQVVANDEEVLFTGDEMQCVHFLNNMPSIETSKISSVEIVPPGQVRVGTYKNGVVELDDNSDVHTVLFSGEQKHME